MKFIYTILLSYFFLTAVAQPITTAVIPPPNQLRCSDVPVRLNGVVFGAVPPNSQDKPVVVFVHGWFDNGYAWFMSKNQWYNLTYNEGYRSAYFFHHYSDAFEKNGKVIADMIRETCRHFNTSKVIAVCHSKGGLDIDWALYNYGIWDSVQGVVTLSSPYYGAPVADLIANPLIRLVTENIPIVGPIFKGKGTYQMQTAYMMSTVRPMLDNHPNNNPQKFHCFGAWGMEHPTRLPSAISDDILKVVFPQYRPLCLEIPGFGDLAGTLMSGFMYATGFLTKLVPVQERYQNPYHNTIINDGLVPYYSSQRPGSIEISPRPNAQESFLNHIDIFRSSETWDNVKPELDYFTLHPQLRTAPAQQQNLKPEAVEAVSDVALFQSDIISFEKNENSEFALVGNYNHVKAVIYNENNEEVKSFTIDHQTQFVYDFISPLDLKDLANGHTYTLKTTSPLTLFIKDGSDATLQLNTRSNEDLFKNRPLNFEVELTNWNEDLHFVTVEGTLCRNMDENGEVVYDKLIPVHFTFDPQCQKFICKDAPDLATGIYNVSVYAKGNKTHRFATTSMAIAMKTSTVDNNRDLKIYPNPAAQNLNISFTSDFNNITLQITDVLGKVQYQKQLVADGTFMHELQLDLNELNLASGLYALSILENEKIAVSKTFVKQ